MDKRKRLFLTIMIVAVGFVVGLIIRSTLPGSDKEREAQVLLDAESLLKAVQPRADGLYELGDDFWATWNVRRATYSAESLEDLRRRLHTFIDHVVAEHADAATIFMEGRRDAMSTAAAEARIDLREAFGSELADVIIADAEALREDAFTASPTTAGFDPGLPDYEALSFVIRDVEPLARQRADELTAPPAVTGD